MQAQGVLQAGGQRCPRAIRSRQACGSASPNFSAAISYCGVYPTYEPQFIEYALVLAWALIPMVVGLVLLGRYRQDILMQ